MIKIHRVEKIKLKIKALNFIASEATKINNG